MRDSMETLSERVSVRERGRGKCGGRELERRKRKTGTDGKINKENEKRERCVTADDDVLFLSLVILGGERWRKKGSSIRVMELLQC